MRFPCFHAHRKSGKWHDTHFLIGIVSRTSCSERNQMYKLIGWIASYSWIPMAALAKLALVKETTGKYLIGQHFEHANRSLCIFITYRWFEMNTKDETWIYNYFACIYLFIIMYYLRKLHQLAIFLRKSFQMPFHCRNSTSVNTNKCKIESSCSVLLWSRIG